MMKWDVKEGKLMKEYNGTIIRKGFTFNCESYETREDKIAFVDGVYFGLATYIIELIKKFNKDEEKLPKDMYGNVKKNSLAAWLKKNDPREICDRSYQHGMIRKFSWQRYVQNSGKANYDIYEDIADEMFHRTLMDLMHREKEWFTRNDPYQVACTSLRKRIDQFKTSFGVPIGLCSNGEVYVEDESWESKRNIRMEEIELLLSKYDELEAFIKNISDNINIKYEA